MICLACGADNPYGQEACWQCTDSLEVPPPHSKPDHVGQVQAALQAHQEGRLEAPEVMRRWRRLLDLAGAFQARWGLDADGGLQGRLAPLLRDRFSGPVAELDGAWADLAAAAGHMDEWGATGDPASAQAASEALEAFFRRSCSAVAWLEKDLEEFREPRGGAGSFVDLRSD